MFITNDGQKLLIDRPFRHNGMSFPRNWLRLTSPDTRAAHGITEVPSTPSSNYNQKFFWGPNNPKDHTQLVENWVSKVKATAGSMLAHTDWMIVRSSDPSSGKVVPDEITTARQLIRDKSDEKEDAILATETTEELAAYVKSSAFHNWGEEVEEPVLSFGTGTSETTSTGNDTLSFSTGSTSAGFS